MKRFVFRLQVVLDRALDEEQALLKQLAHEQCVLTAKEQEIAEQHARRSETMAGMADRQRAGCEIWELQHHRLHLDALAGTLARLEDERQRQEERVDAARATVVEAMRKRQVLEKLREKQLADYQRAVDREELRNMEEIMLPRLAREQAEDARRRQRQAEG